jgi:hypothetical protein
LLGWRSSKGNSYSSAPLTKGDMSTETSAPRLRPHFTPEPGRWIKVFLAHTYLIADFSGMSALPTPAGNNYNGRWFMFFGGGGNVRRTILKLGLVIILALALGSPVAAQTKAKAVDRALDGIKPNEPGVRLVIFDPETGIIDALEALRKNRIFDIPNLTVIGVYHEKQM